MKPYIVQENEIIFRPNPEVWNIKLYNLGMFRWSVATYLEKTYAWISIFSNLPCIFLFIFTKIRNFWHIVEYLRRSISWNFFEFHELVWIMNFPTSFDEFSDISFFNFKWPLARFWVGMFARFLGRYSKKSPNLFELYPNFAEFSFVTFFKNLSDFILMCSGEGILKYPLGESLYLVFYRMKIFRRLLRIPCVRRYRTNRKK